MLRSQREGKQGHRKQDITYQKELGMEHHSPQDFWLQLLKAAFERLSLLYPGPNNGIYFNFPFCVFELDALVVLSNQNIAFEFAGTQYQHKNI
jgi:hypothetical protein